MPQHRILKGKMYIEYSPVELEKLRIDKLTAYYVKHGQSKFNSGHTTTQQTKDHRKGHR